MKKDKLDFLKNLTILLIEDDKELLENLKSTLSVFFKKVMIATDGKKAFEIYKNSNIDIIMTDYVMPIMNGYELCVKIRENNQTIPIVIMSNYSDKEKLLKSITLNLTEYLIKPIDYDTLTATLFKLLNKIKDENIDIQHIRPNIKYNTITKVLINDEHLIPLSKSEIKTLDILIKQKNTLVSTDLISNAIDSEKIKSEQAIKNIIHRLRQKLGKDTIINIQSFGYILKVH